MLIDVYGDQINKKVLT